MKKFTVVAALLLTLVAHISHATDWQGRTSIGIRGPLILPMFEGEDFFRLQGTDTARYEPFMAGWNFGVDLKHGISRNVALGLSLTYAFTYDDTTQADDQSFAFVADDANASAELTGILLGVTGNYFFAPDSRISPYALVGGGADFWSGQIPYNTDSSKDVAVTDLNLKIGAGLLFALSDKLDLGVEARFTWLVHNAYSSVTANSFGPGSWGNYNGRPFRGYLEPAVTLSYGFGGGSTPDGDEDGDGVSDSKDKCPGTPRGALVDRDGCPSDADGDGVFDGIDECPDTPRGATVDAKGCPMDSDKDGVFDGIDKCPGTPAGVVVDATGCPKDSDGDGVFDGIDKCPDTPAGQQVDATGCPVLTGEQGKLAEELRTDKITLNINYASGSHEPDADSKKRIADIAEAMKALPHLNVEIRGYTDNVGGDAMNQSLSERRAGRVRSLLVEGGVAESRLTSKGFGENPQHFVADNNTKEGRAKNRRVELESTNK